MEQAAKIDAPDLLRSGDDRKEDDGANSSGSELNRKGSVEYHFVEEKPKPVQKLHKKKSSKTAKK